MSEDAIRRMNTGELLRRLINNLSSLVDREAVLAKEEVRADAVKFGTGAAVLGIGLLLLYTCVAALIVAAIFAVIGTASILTPAGIALVAAAVFLVLGLIVAGIGWALVRVKPLERTRETLREDMEWARHRIR